MEIVGSFDSRALNNFEKKIKGTILGTTIALKHPKGGFMKFTFLFVTLTFCLPHITHAWDFETTTRLLRSGGGVQAKTRAQELEEAIKCSYEAGVDQTPLQKDRTQWVSEILAQAITQMNPEVSDTCVRHMIAQSKTETGSLGDLTEIPNDKHASSTSAYPGQGTIQTTGVDNYAKLASCVDIFQNKPFPNEVKMKEVSDADKDMTSTEVQDKAFAFMETKPEGKLRNALSALCFFMDTMERHQRFKDACEKTDEASVDLIGVGINHGPGDIGKEPLALDYDSRRTNFKKIESCYN